MGLKLPTKRRKAPRPASRVLDATERLGGGMAPIAPPSRGRLFYDHEIADAFLGGLPRVRDKVRWVRTHLPRETRMKIGRDSAWYELDVVAWLESRGA